MHKIPGNGWLDSSLALKADPYRYISKQCQRYGTDLFETRLILLTKAKSDPPCAHTLADIDYELDITQNGISEIERNIRYVKDFEIIALSKVLEVHPMWLLFGDEIPIEFK